MENASKALIMAAEILFGVILISIMVLGYHYWSNFSNNINKNIELKNIQEFNSRFLIYDGKTNLTAHDVISIVSLVDEYNKDRDDYNKIKVEGTITNINTVINNIPKFIEDNENNKFSLNVVKYQEKSGIVSNIKIMKK